MAEPRVGIEGQSLLDTDDDLWEAPPVENLGADEISPGDASVEKSLSLNDRHRGNAATITAEEDKCDDYCNRMLDEIGVGRYQYLLLLLCGLANASDAVELMSISFLISSTAQCDLMLTDARKGAITSAVFIGMIPGGLTFGLLADRQGRRLWLGTGLFLNAFGTLLSSQASSFNEFLCWRILSGFGVGGSIPVLFSFIVEFAPLKYRGKMLVTTAFFWVVGTVLCAALAWGILGPATEECPTQAEWLDATNSTLGIGDESLEPYCHSIEGTGCDHYNGRPAWRVFLGACCVPAAMTVCMLLGAQESPKWLVGKNQRSRAQTVLEKMAKVNGKDVAIDLPPSAERQIQRAGPGGFAAYVAIVSRVLRPPSRIQFIWLSGVWFCLCFGFYGFRLWMTDFFAEGGVSDSTDIYAASFYVALANVPGYFAAGKTIDWLGRKNTLNLSMCLTGLSLFAIVGARSGDGVLIFSCVFAAVSAGAWCALDVLSVERFPTAVRSSALAMLTVVGRISAILGTLVFGFFSGGAFLVPLLLTGLAFLGGAFCCHKLPAVKEASS